MAHHIISGRVLSTSAVANNNAVTSEPFVPKKDAIEVAFMHNSNVNGTIQRQIYLHDGTEIKGEYKEANWVNVEATVAVTGGTRADTVKTTFVNYPQRFVFTPSANPHTAQIDARSR